MNQTSEPKTFEQQQDAARQARRRMMLMQQAGSVMVVIPDPNGPEGATKSVPLSTLPPVQRAQVVSKLLGVPGVQIPAQAAQAPAAGTLEGESTGPAAAPETAAAPEAAATPAATTEPAAKASARKRAATKAAKKK